MEGNNSSDEETLSEDNTDVSEDSDDVELDVMDDEDDEDDDDDENTRPPEGVVDIDWRKRNEYEGLQKPASSKIYRHTGDVGKLHPKLEYERWISRAVEQLTGFRGGETSSQENCQDHIQEQVDGAVVLSLSGWEDASGARVRYAAQQLSGSKICKLDRLHL